MKVGFSILSHKGPGNLFKELLKQLTMYPKHCISIHHDFHKSDFDASILPENDVFLVKDHVYTEWSHVNNIEAILKTFEILYEQNCDWFITLSANCYPIKKHAFVMDFLTKSPYDAYIECNNINTDHFDFYTYFRKAFQTKIIFSIPFMRKNGTFYLKPIRIKRKPSENIFTKSFIPYHGSDWFIINRKSMEFILSHKDVVYKIVDFMREVNKGEDLNVCPPEVVFQTLLANNKDLYLSHETFRYIDWTNATNWHPNTLEMKDFFKIKNSNALFARKFDSEKSAALINEINSVLLNE